MQNQTTRTNDVPAHSHVTSNLAVGLLVVLAAKPLFKVALFFGLIGFLALGAVHSGMGMLGVVGIVMAVCFLVARSRRAS